MDLLLLGGNSPHNKEWIHQVRDALAPLFTKAVVHEYAHWANAGPSIDLDHELQAIQHQTRQLDDYVIFAKSAGALLAIKGIAQKVLHPQRCVFAGMPLGFAARQGHQVELWLQAVSQPVLCIQNTHDPAASYQDLERFLRQHVASPNFRLAELPGETHDYTDLPKLTQLIAEFVPHSQQQ